MGQKFGAETQLFTCCPFKKRIEAPGVCACLTANLHLEWSTPRIGAFRTIIERLTTIITEKSIPQEARKRKVKEEGIRIVTRDLDRPFIISSRNFPLLELFCKTRKTATNELSIILDLEGQSYR
ncbi:uncharacterized protein Bfra_000714 [Botrytis fragariae]|uniref:Uncharacterized protein n=1 Tax=Botrytis fragariae TaxID=1964551 RepID=A0A8H6B3W9_9HELO|nr:uncharacterized protein Bfra_000714 [Botrytis fragariae]KAF5878547.1 hypothetical protein Bfra_000714 [Botrytis fragariae]